MTSVILGPTFEEMLHPQSVAPGIRAHADWARLEDPLDPINLFNINWRPNPSRGGKGITGPGGEIAVHRQCCSD